MNWRELAYSLYPVTRRVTTRSLVTTISVTTWLAAAKLGRLVLIEFQCSCPHWSSRTGIQFSSVKAADSVLVGPCSSQLYWYIDVQCILLYYWANKMMTMTMMCCQNHPGQMSRGGQKSYIRLQRLRLQRRQSDRATERTFHLIAANWLYDLRRRSPGPAVVCSALYCQRQMTVACCLLLLLMLLPMPQLSLHRQHPSRDCTKLCIALRSDAHASGTRNSAINSTVNAVCPLHL